MSSSRKINMSLLEEELKILINASAKIFPIPQSYLDTNSNPDNYEYGRINNKIFRWDGLKWGYIIADDIDISYNEIKDIPTEFSPKSHTHDEVEIIDLDKYTKSEVDTKLNLKANKTELHSHDNKTILDSISQSLIDGWNNAVSHVADAVKHITNVERTKWNTVDNKANKIYVDSELSTKSDVDHNHDLTYDTIVSVNNKLSNKSDITHNHDGAYYKKIDVDNKLTGKANLSHTHLELDITDLDKYTKVETDNKLSLKSNVGHTHIESDIIGIDKYTKSEVDAKLSDKSNVSHIHSELDITDLDKYTKSEVDTKLSTKSNTNHGHTDLHSHSNKSLLDKITESTPELNYDISNLQYIDDIKNGYTEGHAHNNMTVLNGITNILIDGWNSAVNHITDSIKHITSSERSLWNTVSNKVDKISGKGLSTNDYTTAEKDKLSGIQNNANNYSHPVSHPPSIITQDINNRFVTDVEKTKWNAVDSKASLTYVDEQLDTKTDKSTHSFHINNSDIHVTTLDKTKWNTVDSKVDNSRVLTDVPLNAKFTDTITTINGKTGAITKSDIVALGIPSQDTVYVHPATHSVSMITGLDAELNKLQPIIGTVKPTDGSMWYKVIG